MMKTAGKYICLLLLTLLFSARVVLHAEPAKKNGIQFDTTKIERKDPDAAVRKNYFENEVFQYTRIQEKQKIDETVFDRLWNALWDNIFDERRWGSPNVDNPFTFTNLIILIGIVLLVLFIVKATKSGISSVFKGKSREAEPIDASAEDVDIHGIDYELQIAQALRKYDYRLAVRLLFLRTLKQYSDQGLIDWKPEKTNSDYYYELSGNSHQQTFGALSKIYDYIWYGEFYPQEKEYRIAEQSFRKAFEQSNKH